MKLYIIFEADENFQDHRCILNTEPLIITNSLTATLKWLNQQEKHDCVISVESTLNREIDWNSKIRLLYRQDCLFNPSYIELHRRNQYQPLLWKKLVPHKKDYDDDVDEQQQLHVENNTIQITK